MSGQHQRTKTSKAVKSSRARAKRPPIALAPEATPLRLQQAVVNPRPPDIPLLQRAYGNHAVTSLLTRGNQGIQLRGAPQIANVIQAERAQINSNAHLHSYTFN